MPPGMDYPLTERAPEGVLYFRIFGGIFAFAQALLALFGLVFMLTPLFVPKTTTHSPGDEIAPLVVGLIYGGMGVACLVPTLVALFGGRRPWVHTLGTVVIALGMFNLCCLPVLIPLLIVWMKPETRRWYGAT